MKDLRIEENFDLFVKDFFKYVRENYNNSLGNKTEDELRIIVEYLYEKGIIKKEE